MSRSAADIVAEGHALIAKGHALLADAARVRASEAPPATEKRPSWIPVAESPLGRRKTLQLARTGALESSKVGRKVLIRRASLDALVESGRRGDVAANDDAEDLFRAS